MKAGTHAEYTMASGSNPPYGASINYFLPEDLKEDPSIYILNSHGDTIQHLKGIKEKGINRVWWNLAHEQIELPLLKTKPVNKSFVNLDSTGSRTMFIYDLDIAPGIQAPRIPPGTYVVALKAGNIILKDRLNILKDPNINSSLVDINLQYQHGMELYNSIKHCLSIISDMENKRAVLIKEASRSSLEKEQKIYALESELMDIHQTGARMDIFRNPAKVFERMLSIGKESIANGADFPPTAQQRLVFNKLKDKMTVIEKKYREMKL